MNAVITADIINSTKWPTNYWIESMKLVMNKYGEERKDWEIYRGDELQILLKNPENAFFISIDLKSELKKKSMDARISIGLGTVDFTGENVKENSGSAFINSGRNLEEMKKNKSQSITLKSENQNFDETINLIFLLLEQTFEKWTPSSANAVSYYINHQHFTQQELSEKLGISQGALSRALKRANVEGVLEVDHYFKKKITAL